MEVLRISQECVKPSSPTPLPLKTYKFCLLDQFVPPVFFHMNLFYSNQDPTLLANNDAISKRSLFLKQSLSKTLAHYYPLAGKIRDNLSIDCNDDGVHYVEARVNIPLHQYLDQPDVMTSMSKLSPRALFHPPCAGDYVTMIQETTFACGGIGIAVSIPHMLMDGISLSSFLKHLAAAASMDTENIVYPSFDAASIFPQHVLSPSETSFITGLMIPFLKMGKADTRRFVFDESAVAALKAKAEVENPSRVEAVSAFLVKCIMDVFKIRSGINKPTFTAQAVNLRRRTEPPLPEGLVGNLIWGASALVKPEETSLSGIIGLWREAIKTEICSELVKKLQGDGGFYKICDKIYEERKGTGKSVTCKNEVDYVTMTSWCNFGLNEIDFGWGKPTWAYGGNFAAGRSETSYMNAVLLMDAKGRKGIEAFVTLTEQELDTLEKHEELLAYASPIHKF